MYVCICAAVTDSTITKAVKDGQTNWKALCKDLHIAQECGKCGQCARAIFDEVKSGQSGAKEAPDERSKLH